MVLWINGCPGAGKTTAATLLAKRLNGILVDPETIGRKIQRITNCHDYQYSSLWRTAVRTVILLAAIAKSPVVVPMTVLDPEVRARLKLDGKNGRWPKLEFLLGASENELKRRIIHRGGAHGTWCLQNLQRFLAYPKPASSIEVDTENVRLTQVADTIANLANSHRWL